MIVIKKHTRNHNDSQITCDIQLFATYEQE